MDKSDNRKKILAVASNGGHWVQLLRLKTLFEHYDTVYVTTDSSNQYQVDKHSFYTVTDANRWKKYQLIILFFDIFKIVKKERPNIIISTGAAPGLLAIIIGRAFGAKTIWVDSIANVEKLSLSGKLSVRVAHKVYTQWPKLAIANKVFYAGNILS